MHGGLGIKLVFLESKCFIIIVDDLMDSGLLGILPTPLLIQGQPYILGYFSQILKPYI